MGNQVHHSVAPLHYPDINKTNLIFIDRSTLLSDEFRMYAYKIKQCPRNQSHDWTSCPFAHQGERARRRDLSRSYYTAIPCLEFKNGGCEKGGLCELAHGIFESWLHPAKYKTRKCHAGELCRRNVCFFAHTKDEGRPETTYKRYVLTDPLNPAMVGRCTIGFESNGRIILPFQNRYGTVSSTHANHLLVSASGTGCDEVADSLAMLNIKDGEYELQKPKMTVGSSLRSSCDASCSNSNDLPQELKWVAELMKDS